MTTETISAVDTVFGDLALRKLLHSIEALVVTLTPKGTIVDCNGTCEQISGFTEEELVGRNIARVFAIQKEVGLLQERINQLVAGEPLGRFETYLLTKLGDCRRIRWSGVQIETPDHPLPALMLTGIDLTRELDVSERLSRAEKQANVLKEQLVRIGNKYSLDEEINVDRRAERRLKFNGQQRIAPLNGQELPCDNDFFRVQCDNIGARGMGFFLSDPPRAREYIVELGKGRRAIYLTAEVKHATVNNASHRQGFLVGCKFTGRITD